MAWSDEPTEAQLNALWYWLKWELPAAELTEAMAWLKEHATRKEVSTEMARVRELHANKRLNREECFKGEVWNDYFNERKEQPKRKVRLVVDDGK